MAKANDTIHNPFHSRIARKANQGPNPPLDTQKNLERLIKAVTQIEELVETVAKRNESNRFRSINHLALAIEVLADPLIKHDPERTLPEALNPLIFQGLFVGIQHLAQKINQLTQTPVKSPLEKEV